jgi:hypothetical protein
MNSSSCGGRSPATHTNLTSQTQPFNLSFSILLHASGSYHVEALLLQPGAALASVFRSCMFDPSITSCTPQALMNRLSAACVSSSAAQVQSVAVTRSASTAAGSRDVVEVSGFLRPPGNGSDTCIITSASSGGGGSWLLSSFQSETRFNFTNARSLVERLFFEF